jgi:dTMP kinase
VRAGDAPDRIEAESLDFHRRVRTRFLELADDDHDRYLVVDASLPPEQVFDAVRRRLELLLPTPAGAPLSASS